MSSLFTTNASDEQKNIFIELTMHTNHTENNQE